MQRVCMSRVIGLYIIDDIINTSLYLGHFTLLAHIKPTLYIDYGKCRGPTVELISVLKTRGTISGGGGALVFVNPQHLPLEEVTS